MVATPAVIIWMAFNTIGVFVAIWLAYISYNRKLSLMEEKYPITPKKPRIDIVNRQIRDRVSRTIFHSVALLIGLFALLDYKLPFDLDSWALVALAVLLAIVSVVDLQGELKS